MQKFTVHTGVAAPLLRPNVNTDVLVRIERMIHVPRGQLGPHCFEAWRYRPDGSEDPEFVLNRPPYRKATILIAGDNFGCGSSREHAPIAMGSASCKIVLAESFARIFFRNCVATGELYPCECVDRLCELLKTGDVISVDLDAATVTVANTGKTYKFKPLGDVRPVVDAGGLFNYARETGMIAAK